MKGRYVFFAVFAAVLLVVSTLFNVAAYNTLVEMRRDLKDMQLLASRVAAMAADVNHIRSEISELKKGTEWVQGRRVTIEGSTAIVSWVVSPQNPEDKIYLLYKRGEEDWKKAEMIESGPEFRARIPIKESNPINVLLSVEVRGGGVEGEVKAGNDRPGERYEYLIVVESGSTKKVAGPYYFAGAKPSHAKVVIREHNDLFQVQVLDGEGFTWVLQAASDGKILDELTIEVREDRVARTWAIPPEANELKLLVKKDGEVKQELSHAWGD